jgi:hypothetical protein
VIRPISCLAVSLLVLSSCESVPHHRGVAVHSTEGDLVVQEAPIEIAVAPVVNASGASLPAAALRDAFQKELVDRRYSPLALDYVDRKVVEAAYTPGASDEQATLVITVEKWDASLWTTHGAITAKVVAQLIDATGGGKVLWSATADQRFDFPALREHLSTETARMKFACDEIAAELLAKLPPRTARPGRLAKP